MERKKRVLKLADNIAKSPCYDSNLLKYINKIKKNDALNEIASSLS
jgi:hypothetical protein